MTPLPRMAPELSFAACDFLQVQGKALKIKTIFNSELSKLFRTLLQLPKAVLDVPEIYSHISDRIGEYMNRNCGKLQPREADN